MGDTHTQHIYTTHCTQADRDPTQQLHHAYLIVNIIFLQMCEAKCFDEA